jgi:hypothetical protein
MNRYWLIGMLLTGLVLMLTACEPARVLGLMPTLTATATATAAQTPQPQVLPPTKSPPQVVETPTAGLTEKFVDLTQRDLAERLKLAVDEVTLVEAVAMTWPDAALGCPSPGKVYAQGRVPGFKITLQANAEEFVYHTDHTGQIILCPELRLDAGEGGFPTPAGPTPQIGVPIK